MGNERTINPNPPADFTPTLGDYKTLQPFRYWCQKVLPLVYDDSLSYYELLCKVVDYLNKTMEDVETLHGDVTNLHTAYEELQSYVNDYFSTLDVQEEINNKLNQMASDGTLSALIEPLVNPRFININEAITNINNDINTLTGRINSFTNLTVGSTTGDAELIDGRIGFLDTTYENIGDAIRTQNKSEYNAIQSLYSGAKKENSIYPSELKFMDTTVTSRNKLNPNNLLGGFGFNYNTKNGSIVCRPESVITDFIEANINENNEWVFSISHGDNIYLCISFYDENYNFTGFDFIKSITSTDPDIQEGSNKYTFPIYLRTKLSGKYMRISWNSVVNEVVQLENNSVVTYYTPYNETASLPNSMLKNPPIINSNIEYTILNGYIDTNNTFVASNINYTVRFKAYAGKKYIFNCKNSTLLRISGFKGFQSGVNNDNTYNREFDTSFCMINEKYENYEITLTEDYEMFAFFGVHNFKNWSISEEEIKYKMTDNQIYLSNIFEPKSLYWLPDNHLQGATTYNDPFFLYTNTAYELYTQIYDKLVEKYPGELTRVSIGTGYDASNTFPMYAYIHEPEYYEQSIILQSGAHGGETLAWIMLARFTQLLFEQHENHEWLSYLWYNCKITIVPCVNIWGGSQSVHTDLNSDGVSVQSNITAGTSINPDGTPIQETLNMRSFYANFAEECSIFIDVHTSGRYTTYGNYCLAVSEGNPAYRAARRVASNLCRKHFGNGGTTVFLPIPSDPGINTYRNYMQTYYDLCAVTCELSLSGWSQLTYEPVKFEMGCEYLGNLIIELLKLKYKIIS